MSSKEETKTEEKVEKVENENALKLQNRHLVGLASWLNTLKLPGKLSRNRTRFISLLQPRMQENQKFSEEIIAKYAKKDKDGNPKRRTENGTEVWDIPDKKLEDFNKDMLELLQEEFVIAVTPENKHMLGDMRDLVLETEVEFSGEDAVRYNIWCEAFEPLEVE